MKTKTLVLRHWEDVVFENRNKVYGAYVLRRSYSKRVIVGWGITVAFVAALLYLSDLSLPDAASMIKPFESDNEREIKLSEPPSLHRKKPDPVQAPRPKSKPSSQIVVTSDPVETTVKTVEAVETVPDATGTGGSQDGTVEGTSTIPVVNLLYVEPPKVRDIAEVMPRYDGGQEAMMKFIKKKIRIPGSFRYLTEGGTVYVRFVVRPDGKVTDVEVIRGLSKDCDKEAMRVIEMMPGWIAGMQNGTNVPVRMVLPIKFAHE